ncbi:MAG: hypothetical protein LUD77_11190 [Clostridiales bacterium]|nr:hypothetical protein [Clostridiales bacterium]
MTDELFKLEKENGGAETSVSGADFSAFVPSLNSYTESLSDSSSKISSENINDVLNNYYGGAEGSRSITNNISPSFNFYGGSSGGDIDIDDIAEKIGEMLMEAAAGSAEGFYG